jgi:FSR family fosmidomycin resistance protein-like MFS transporter
MFFGFAFGLGGVGAALMGWLADLYGISFVYQLCSYLPILGLVAWFLPDMAAERRKYLPVAA